MKSMKFHSCVASKKERIKPSLAVEEPLFSTQEVLKKLCIIQKYI